MTSPQDCAAHWRTRALYLLTCLILLGAAASSAAAASHRSAHSRRTVYAASTHPRKLMRAGRANAHADRVLVAAAKRMKRCRAANPSRPVRCRAAHHSLQKAGSNLARAQRHLSQVARSTGGSSASASTRGQESTRYAPHLTVSGQTLRWNAVAGIDTYVLMRKVPGQTPQYTIVHGTSTTPPPVPGVTVSYSVRTTAWWSTWSTEQSITYPGVSESPKSEPVKAPDPQAAPSITVSGATLTWNAVAGITTYVLVTKVPGQTDKYSEVSGTSFTPPAVAGKTVKYSVRTAVEGSAWAPEVSITFPSAPAPAPKPEGEGEGEPAPVPSSVTAGPFEMGVVAGTSGYELPFIQTVGAHTVRMEVGIGSSAAEVAPLVEFYAKAGVRLLLLAGFNGQIPSPAEAQNLASWAAAFGPGGTLWKGKTFPADTAVTTIEFGNETSYTYQFSDNSSSTYASRAQSYALRFKEAQTAIQSANPSVGLLAQADSGGGGSAWVDNMFAAVPDLASRVAGWTVHPYGANWQGRLDQTVSTTAAHGAPSTIPIYVTEWGLASDNGNCLSDNYGWNRCMSYAEAATTLTTTLTAMRARYGSRLAALYLYHVRDQKPSGASTDREAYFGAVQSNGAAKGLYTTTVQALIAANR